MKITLTTFAQLMQAISAILLEFDQQHQAMTQDQNSTPTAPPQAEPKK